MSRRTHVDDLAMNTDGTMTITITEWMNAAIAALFAGATVSGVVTNPVSEQVTMVITVTPSAPFPQAATDDRGQSTNEP